MIPFLDLKAQYESIRGELEAAVLKALAGTQYALGSEVAAFEEEFAAFCGAESAVAVNSGTSALHVALLVAGVERGDEVITVASTFVATVAAIDYVGARPVFVDVEPGICYIIRIGSTFIGAFGSGTLSLIGHFCPDLNDDGIVGPTDLSSLLINWGPCDGCAADVNGDGDIGPTDLAILLVAWGPCP